MHCMFLKSAYIQCTSLQPASWGLSPSALGLEPAPELFPICPAFPNAHTTSSLRGLPSVVKGPPAGPLGSQSGCLEVLAHGAGIRAEVSKSCSWFPAGVHAGDLVSECVLNPAP